MNRANTTLSRAVSPVSSQFLFQPSSTHRRAPQSSLLYYTAKTPSQSLESLAIGDAISALSSLQRRRHLPVPNRCMIPDSLAVSSRHEPVRTLPTLWSIRSPLNFLLIQEYTSRVVATKWACCFVSLFLNLQPKSHPDKTSPSRALLSLTLGRLHYSNSIRKSTSV